jgi:uncharacterized RDD family membrane protein YckC
MKNIDSPSDQEDQDIRLAHLSERAVAFTIDYVLFMVLFAVSMKTVFPEFNIQLNPHGMTWSAIWIGLFVLYQGYCSSEGRQSLGKWAIGIRVVNLEGGPLSLTQALIRAAGYIGSSILCLGFAWARFNPARQTLHDLMAGTGVIEDRPQESGLPRMLIKAGAFACLFAFAGLWSWENLIARNYYRNMTIAYSHVGLEEIAQLQEMHKISTGRYADNIIPLAMLSGNPDEFMKDMSDLFDPEEGIRIERTRDGFKIKAFSRDLRHTPVEFIGPKPKTS